ncbi:uncharacterized protein DUF1524 [Mycoplasmopsis mustelae]|uniref:Uncharacterized protein DUF1524 n=1 Tax=Mycoplasmopsis mustelae TaxID=171289 RepID=A0A4R7UDG8_9BACT|nr:DUF262 domain-containing protein [Mycoplasmopsis mustelae]TDV24086.1 uncharacterized protein DUF1524 [Mycoplasmopsis mustelae]
MKEKEYLLDLSKKNFENGNKFYEDKKENIDPDGIGDKQIIGFLPNLYQYLFFYSNNKISIPIFQRHYEWTKETIDGLLQNIIDKASIIEMDNKNNNQRIKIFLNKKLFLNNIILTYHDNKPVIIDGQQRTTTLFLITVALIKYYFNAKFYKNKQTLSNSEEKFFNFNFINKQIHEIEEKFGSDHLNYIVKIFKGDISDLDEYDKKMFNIFEHIYKKLSDFFENMNDIEEFKKFVKFFMECIKINVTLIKVSSEHESSKIYENINLYSKPLELTDLLKNNLYSKLIQNKNSKKQEQDWLDNNKIKTSLNLFDKTWNIYFRKSTNLNGGVIKDLLSVFLYSLFINNNLLNEDEIKKPTKTLEFFIKKFDELITRKLPIQSLNEYKFTKLEDDLFINDLLIFNFISYNKKREEEYKKIINKNERIKKLSEQLNNIKEIWFIKEQIRHITSLGNKNIFFYPIFTLLKEFKLFDLEILSKKDNDKNNQKRYLKNIHECQEVLFELEKFAVNWKFFNYNSQSLAPKMMELSFKIKENIKNRDELISIDLKEVQSELSKISENLKFADLYNDIDDLLNDLNNPDKKEERLKKLDKLLISNTEKTIILRRINSYINDLKKDDDKYLNRNYDMINFDHNYNFEHILPNKKPNTSQNLSTWNDNEYNLYKERIGNGSLITKSLNSFLRNKETKEQKNKKAVENNTDKKNFTVLGFNENNNTLKSGIDLFASIFTSEDDQQEIINSIQERSVQILKIYFEIFSKK